MSEIKSLNQLIRENDEDNVVIVTRHDCLVRWLESKGIHGKVMPVARANDLAGKVVITFNVPIHLVAFAKYAVMIFMKNDSGKPFEDLTPEDMDKQFMQVQMYHIERQKIDLNDKDIVDKINKGEMLYEEDKYIRI